MNKLVNIVIFLCAGFALTNCGNANARSWNLACYIQEGFINCLDKKEEDKPKDGLPGKDADPVFVGRTDDCEGSPGVEVISGETRTCIKDGADGDTGPKGDKGDDGMDGSMVELVYPCGASSVTHGEILLKIDGVFIAYFQKLTRQGGSSSPLTDVQGRLTVLQENVTYQLTDGSNCKFKVVNGSIVVL